MKKVIKLSKDFYEIRKKIEKLQRRLFVLQQEYNELRSEEGKLVWLQNKACDEESD
jgi:hypothetical protein